LKIFPEIVILPEGLNQFAQHFVGESGSSSSKVERDAKILGVMCAKNGV